MQRLARRYGWMRPPALDLNPAMQRTEAERAALAGGGPSRFPPFAPAGAPPLAAPQDDAGGGAPSPPARDTADGDEPLSIDRMERTVMRELAAVDRMRMQLGDAPQSWIEARETARTLASLTHTLQMLQRMRQADMRAAAQPDDDDDFDDMPENIDEFRKELARRIDAFVATRTAAQEAEAAASAEAKEG